MATGKVAPGVYAPACPACSGPAGERYPGLAGVYVCARCGAVYGSCYLGESYAIVLPQWSGVEVAPDRMFHYDLECLGSEGITRRHGWADRETRRIVQTG